MDELRQVGADIQDEKERDDGNEAGQRHIFASEKPTCGRSSAKRTAAASDGDDGRGNMHFLDKSEDF